MMRVASCSADISSEKKPTTAPSSAFSDSWVRPIVPRHVIGDVGGERRLAHRGAPGDDDQVGGLQAAHAVVEIGEAGGETRQAAIAPIGIGRHVDGVGERGGERLEARAVFAGLGELVELLLGVLDLHRRRRIDRRIEGRVDHGLADLDQLAADGEVVDGAAVILGIDDGRGIGGEAPQILRHGELADRLVVLEEGLERDRGRPLAAQDELRGVLVDAPMQGSKKCAAFRKLETRSMASLLTRMAPSSACSASRLWGGARKAGSSAGAGRGQNQSIGHGSQ